MVGDELNSHCTKIMHSVETLQDIMVKHLGIVDTHNSQSSFGDGSPKPPIKFATGSNLQKAFIESHGRLSRFSQKCSQKDTPNVPRLNNRKPVSKKTTFEKPEDNLTPLDPTTKSNPNLPEISTPG